MIDESRVVSIKRGIDHDIVIDRKEIGMMSLFNAVGISLICFDRRNTLPGVLDDARASRDRPGRESPKPLNR